MIKLICLLALLALPVLLELLEPQLALPALLLEPQPVSEPLPSCSLLL